jgi:hypothetical protein
MKTKKAAMFGLDARIAMAIFASLSVIAGAALYNTIKETKATQYLTEMQDLGKALEAHYLDTGVYPTKSGPFSLMAGELVDNSKGYTNWKGNYLPRFGTSDISGVYLRLADEQYAIGVFNELDWNSQVPVCMSGQKCFVYTSWIPDSSDELLAVFNALDARIDGSDGRDLGNIRRDMFGGVSFKYMPYPAVP